MADATLRNCRILVVEDEYLLAAELETELGDAGAVVLGPVASVAGAVALIDQAGRIDGALLDVNLGGDWVFPAADLLIDRDVPFLFTTGYDASSIPSRFAHVARCDKPLTIGKVTAAIVRIMKPG